MGDKSGLLLVGILCGLLLAVYGCHRLERVDLSGGETDTDADTDADADADSDSDSDYPEYPADAVDVLVIVNNSTSMHEEQTLLATNAFTLVHELIDPPPDSEIPGLTDSVRVAVVSSDMGFQWGGNPYDPDDFEEGEGWPEEVPDNCEGLGDNGEFLTYPDGKLIDLENGVIPCDESAAQCPAGWECGNFVDSEGTCHAPNEVGQEWECPSLAGDWAETSPDTDPDFDLAGQVACLTSVGTNGCKFEQQLQAGAVALHKESQADFTRDDAVLLVIVVTDEEDCSIEDKELFGVDEIHNPDENENGIACGSHPDYLYEVKHFKQTFAAVKGGNPNGVLFAAIVGVPVDDACQGRGDEIGGCLDHPEMELEVVYEGYGWFFKPACIRYGGTEVTRARPGRRFVELAQTLGENGYVYSICNKDWTEAMHDIAQMIADELTD